jgi:hypothetical protein
MKAAVLESKKEQTTDLIERQIDLLLASKGLTFEDPEASPIRKPEVKVLVQLERIAAKQALFMSSFGIKEPEPEEPAEQTAPEPTEAAEEQPAEESAPEVEATPDKPAGKSKKK